VTVSGNKVICKGNTLNLLASGASTYTWNTGSNSPGIAVSPTVTTTYSVTGTNGAGCSQTSISTVTVTNNTAPTISATGPSVACANSNVNLAANGASTYTWQPGNLNGFFVTVSMSVTTTFTVTGTDNNGCENFAVYTQSVEICSGLKEGISADEIGVFPNPVTSDVTLSGLKDYSTVHVLNNLGQIILMSEIKNEKETIQLDHLAKGVYFLKLTNGNNFVIKKIVKE
ncbi:MAG: hypothetical protein K0S12_921, partial [Bacteroidetes bacterium]|nr:hypothetical protein [Bacteroidota bacterium]